MFVSQTIGDVTLSRQAVVTRIWLFPARATQLQQVRIMGYGAIDGLILVWLTLHERQPYTLFHNFSHRVLVSRGVGS
jgi:hypothetical protein